MDRPKPKYIKIELITEKDEFNQTMLIDCAEAVNIITENEPIFKKNIITDKYDYNRLRANVYLITVDYGEEGIDVKNLQKN